MIYLNQQRVIGNLGRKPELRYTAQGKPVLSFSLASTKPADTTRNFPAVTTWFDVVVWGKSGETLSKQLDKGSRVYVEGETQKRKWTDKDGKEHYQVEIVVVNPMAHQVLVIAKDQHSAQEPAFVHPGAGQLPPDNSLPTDDQLPF